MTKYISIVIVLFLISCTKQQEILIPTTTPEEITLEEKNKMMLNTAAIGLLAFTKEQNFRNQVHEKVLEAFDDDYNVLLKGLAKEEDLAIGFQSSIAAYANKVRKNNQTAFATYSYCGDFENISKAINGYEVGDEVWYPQIYVPFHEQVDLKEIPVIAVSHSGEEEVLLGYKLLLNGEVEVLTVDEQYAQTHLIWVISVNESVDNDGNLPNGKEHIVTNNLRNDPLFIRTEEVKISDKKEKWHQGKADVRVGYSNIDTPMPNTNCNNTNWYHGAEVKIGNNKLNTWVPLITGLARGNGAISDRLEPGETILFMLYEYDRNANLRERIFTPCFHSYYYRSDDNLYMAWGPFENMDYGDFPNPATSPNWSYRTRTEGNEEVKFGYKKF